jgi:hypothetical protein
LNVRADEGARESGVVPVAPAFRWAGASMHNVGLKPDATKRFTAFKAEPSGTPAHKRLSLVPGPSSIQTFGNCAVSKFAVDAADRCGIALP